jgi:hypothetical protein
MQRFLFSGRLMLAAATLVVTATSEANAAIKNRYSFTANADDSVGGANGNVVDPGVATAAFAGGKLNLSANIGELSNAIGEDAYVNLPNGIVSALGTKGSFETWVTVETNRNWAEIFSFGQSRIDSGGEDISAGFGKYVTLIPDTGDGPNTFRLEAIQFPDGSPAFDPFGASNVSTPDNATLSTGVEHHIVSIFDSTDTMGGANPNGTMRNYLNGALVAASPLYAGFTLGSVPDVNNWLGRSQWGDPLFDGSFNEFRIHDNALAADQVALNNVIGPDQTATVPAAGIFSIEVNTVTNSITLSNNLNIPLNLNYYEITSAGGALSTGGWNSLDDQEGGDPPGQGWDQSGGVTANQLIELALPPGGVSIAANADLSLGAAFNKAVFGNGVNGDLAFKFGLTNGALLSGSVTYVTGPGGDDADFDSDGDVDGADFLRWQRGFGTSGAGLDDGDANGDGNVNAADLAIWKTQFGAAAVPAAASVPEPATLGLGSIAALLLTIAARNRGGRDHRS